MTELDELIRKCIQKDTRAEYALYRMYFNPLMRICWRYTKNEDDAAAMLNKGFLKILTGLQRYDKEQPFDKWIKTIMINTIIDEFRSNRKTNEMFVLSAPGDINDYYQSVDMNKAEQKLTIDEIVAEVKKLPEPSMQVFNMFVFDAMTHKEISEQLNIPESTSRWHLASARTVLKKNLSLVYSTLRTLVV